MSGLSFHGLLLFALLLAACGAEPERAERAALDRRYAEAERAFSRRDDDRAFALFGEIATDRMATRDARALARFRQAELRERQGRIDEAEAIYGAVVEMDAPERAALAAYRLATLAIEARGDREGGEARLRAIPFEHPDSVAADKVVRELARRPMSAREARAFLEWLESVVIETYGYSVADNALWWKAHLEIFALGDLGAARSTLRRFTRLWPESPLIDDVLWRLADVYHRQGEAEHAVTVLTALMNIRNETSYLIGSYRSARMDDAALRIGHLRYHVLRDFPGAVAAFRLLLDEFSTSVLRDDAWWGLANALLEQDDRPRAEAALDALLAEDPKSRFAPRARALRDGDEAARWRPDPAALPAVLLDPDERGAR